MQPAIIIALLSSFLFFLGGKAQQEKPSFAKDIYLLVKTYCVKCHKPGGSKKAQGLLMEDAETALDHLLNSKPTDENFSNFVIPGKSEKSVMYLKLIDPPYGKKMPLGSEKPSKEEIELIKTWIDSGAQK